MAASHFAISIVPCGDIVASEAFYSRLGLETVSDYGHYKIMADNRGWHLHLTQAPGWPPDIEGNPYGLYLYVEDVDAVAERVRDLIIEPGDPQLRPWGTYEFSVSDPNGMLIRIGRITA